MVEEEDDVVIFVEVEVEFEVLKKMVGEFEVCMLFNGEMDECEVLVIICVEVGGVDVVDFVEMLLRMYLCWVECYGYFMEVMDIFYVEEVGLKLVIFVVYVFYVYGML